LWNDPGATVPFNSEDLALVGSDWTFLGIGDFDGDGKADVLWRNNNTGLVRLWNDPGATVPFNSEDLALVGSDWTFLKMVTP
jgi:hypothetical protein